jgi:hypothetical protein
MILGLRAWGGRPALTWVGLPGGGGPGAGAPPWGWRPRRTWVFLSGGELPGGEWAFLLLGAGAPP